MRLDRNSRGCSRRIRETACFTDGAFGVFVHSQLHSSIHPPLNFMILPCPLFGHRSAGLALVNLDRTPHANLRYSASLAHGPCQ